MVLEQTEHVCDLPRQPRWAPVVLSSPPFLPLLLVAPSRISSGNALCSRSERFSHVHRRCPRTRGERRSLCAGVLEWRASRGYNGHRPATWKSPLGQKPEGEQSRGGGGGTASSALGFSHGPSCRFAHCQACWLFNRDATERFPQTHHVASWSSCCIPGPGAQGPAGPESPGDRRSQSPHLPGCVSPSTGSPAQRPCRRRFSCPRRCSVGRGPPCQDSGTQANGFQQANSS